MPVTLGNAFNSTANAFTLHDDSSFENALQQSNTSTHSNPFNDSVSAFNEPSPIKSTSSYNVTPKKEFEFLSTNNENLNAIFSSYSNTAATAATISSNKSEIPNGIGGASNQDFGIKKNPFSANEKNTWNELNALDLNKLKMDFNGDEGNSSIFATTMNQDQLSGKTEVKKEIPVDLFKDVAMELFSEFNTPRHKNNEFFNKISGFDAVRT